MLVHLVLTKLAEKLVCLLVTYSARYLKSKLHFFPFPNRRKPHIFSSNSNTQKNAEQKTRTAITKVKSITMLKHTIKG